MTSRTIVNILGYAGLVPFGVGAGLVWYGYSAQNINGLSGFVSYSALILSFLAGILWGRSLEALKSAFVKISSNGFVLLAWASLLVLPINPLISVILLTIGFVVLYGIERRQFELLFSSVDSFYKYFRFSLTAMVVMMHAFVLVALIK